MSLVNPQDIEKVWGSHQPVLRSVLNILKPERVVECGTGFYSTPTIMDHSKKSIHIEHDPVWYKRVRDCYSIATIRSIWYLKDFRAGNATAIQELPSGEFENICTYYKGMAKIIDYCDMLFVDTFRAARVPALMYLGPISRNIILHDLEGNSPAYYEYDRVKGSLTTHFWRYTYRPKGYINGHVIPWTNLYTSLPISSFDELNKDACFESRRLWGMDVCFEKEV